METLKQASKQIIGQLIGLAENLADEKFTKPLPVLLNNSIGKHYRHVIEFYMVMFKGVHTGRINYDSRQHDPELEESRERCLAELKKISQHFNEPFWLDPMELTGSYSLDSDETFTLSTNAEREMVYNIEHAIHHMAIIRIAVTREFSEIQLEEEFGYAYSTLKHLRKE